MLYKYIFRKVLLFHHNCIVKRGCHVRYGPSGLFHGADKSVGYFGASYIDSTPQLFHHLTLFLERWWSKIIFIHFGLIISVLNKRNDSPKYAPRELPHLHGPGPRQSRRRRPRHQKLRQHRPAIRQTRPRRILRPLVRSLQDPRPCL